MTEKLTTSEKKVVAEEKEAEKVFQENKSLKPLSPDQLHRINKVLQHGNGSKLKDIEEIMREGEK